jgi:hypothetical protein
MGRVMQASKITVVSIAKPFSLVYEFLADPRNFTQWASAPGASMRQLGERDWVVEIPDVGERVIRFAPRNEFGVLDYQAYAKGAEPGPTTPVRLYANGEGADLAYTQFQRRGVSDEQFASDTVWLQTDLARLKTLLESR